jgi:hypothetical protein
VRDRLRRGFHFFKEEYPKEISPKALGRGSVSRSHHPHEREESA